MANVPMKEYASAAPPKGIKALARSMVNKKRALKFKKSQTPSMGNGGG